MASRSEINGVVVSDKMDKSVVVAIERPVRHQLYGKLIRRRSTFVAHDEGNDAKLGDHVVIVEGRPISRRKRWAVVRIVKRVKSL